MEKIKEGSVVKVISDGRIGEVMGVKRKKAMVAFRNKQMIERDIEEYDLEDIEIYHMPEFTAKLMKSYIRGEISFSKLTKGSSIFPSEMTGEYKVNPVDILSGVRVVKNASGWEKYAWVTMIIRFFREIGISYGKPPKNKISDEDIVNCAFREILAISDEMEDELTETLDGSFDRLENMLADWIDSGNQKCPNR